AAPPIRADTQSSPMTRRGDTENLGYEGEPFPTRTARIATPLPSFGTQISSGGRHWYAIGSSPMAAGRSAPGGCRKVRPFAPCASAPSVYNPANLPAARLPDGESDAEENRHPVDHDHRSGPHRHRPGLRGRLFRRP